MACYEPTSPFRGTDGGLSPGDLPVIGIDQNTAGEVSFSAVDSALTGQFEKPDGEDPYVPVLLFQEHWNMGRLYRVLGVRDASDTFTFTFETEDTSQGGIHTGSVCLFASDDDEYALPLWSLPVYVEVRPNLTGSRSAAEPLSIAEIRLALRDLGAPFNSLLDDYEFTNQEIAMAIRRTVDEWNEIPPQVASYTYTNFPYRYHWSIGAMGNLMLLAARHKERNHLNYSAGGVSVDDTSRYRSMREEGFRLRQQWREFVANKKREINWHLSWGYA